MKKKISIILAAIAVFFLAAQMSFAETHLGHNFKEYSSLTAAQKAYYTDIANQRDSYVFFKDKRTASVVYAEFAQIDPWREQANSYFNDVQNDNRYGQGLYAAYKIGKFTNNGKYYFYATKNTNKAAKTNLANAKTGNARIKNTVKALNLGGKTNFEKTVIIYDWITRNIKYDRTLRRGTSYQAITTKSVVCQGYSNLMRKMLTEAGIPCKYAGGIGRIGPHAWVVVKLGGQWYYCDPTYDAGKPAGQWQFFLKGKNDFKSHRKVKDYCIKGKKLAARQYPEVASLSIAKTKVTKASFNGRTLSVRWKSVPHATGYQIRYRTRADKTYKMKTVRGTSSSVSLSKSSNSIIYSLRAYRKIGNIYIYSKWGY